MPTIVTHSVGVGKTYTTIAAWLAACPSDLVASDVVWKGELYKGTYNETVTFPAPNGDMSHYIWMTSAVSDRHSWKPGTGPIIKPTVTTGAFTQYVYIPNPAYVYKNHIDWLEFDFSAVDTQYGSACINSGNNIFQNNIFHGINSSTGSVTLLQVGGYDTGLISNNLFYDINTGGAHWNVFPINTNGPAGCRLYNNTIVMDGSSGAGFFLTNSGSIDCQNNICIGSAAVYGDFWVGAATVIFNNNISGDTTAPTIGTTYSGTGNLGSKTIAGNFAGATVYNFRLITGADALGAGTNLTSQGQGVNVSLDGITLPATGAWDCGCIPYGFITDISSIGNPSLGRTFSNPQAWAASIPSNLINAAMAVEGQMYKDYDYNVAVSITGITTDATHTIKLTTGPAQYHYGIAGAGVRFYITDPSISGSVIYMDTSYTTIENLEITYGPGSVGGYSGFIESINGTENIIRRNLCHGMPASYYRPAGISINCYTGTADCNNNIIYGVNYADSAIVVSGNYLHADLDNNTIWNCNYGISFYAGGTGSGSSCRNNIYIAPSGITGFFMGYTPTYVGNNISSDGTAPGASSKINVSASTQFVNTGSGTEDLHLKTGSDAIMAGANLGTDDGVNIDINLFNRLSAAYTWDVGAHQFNMSLFSPYWVSRSSRLLTGGILV